MAEPANMRGYFREKREYDRRMRVIAEARSDIRRAQQLGLESVYIGETEEDILKRQDELSQALFGVYDVRVLPKIPENYYKGPTASTRVASHKFVPTQEQLDENGISKVSSGDVYVRFARPSRQQSQGAVYLYKNVPVEIYNRFVTTYSKGKYINSDLDPYKVGNVAGTAEAADLE